MGPPRDRMTARSSRLRSSRTLPGEGVGGELRERRAGDGGCFHFQLARDRREQLRDERRDVLRPVAQRRDAQRENGEAVIEVLSEGPFAHPLLEVAVRGGDDPHVHALGQRRSHAEHLARDEDAEQLGLKRKGHLPRLIEKQRAAVGSFEDPGARPVGAGECAALVPEELALEQGLGEAGAVDRQEDPLGSAARLVEGTGDELLPAARLAQNQDRRVGRREALHQLAQLPYRRTLPDQLARANEEAHLPAQSFVLAVEPGSLSRSPDDRQDLFPLKGFRQEIERARAHGVHRQLHGSHSGQKNHGNGGIRFAAEGEDVETGAIRHDLVGDHDVDLSRGDRPAGRGDSVRLDDLVTLLFENGAEQPPHG